MVYTGYSTWKPGSGSLTNKLIYLLLTPVQIRGFLFKIHAEYTVSLIYIYNKSEKENLTYKE